LKRGPTVGGMLSGAYCARVLGKARAARYEKTTMRILPVLLGATILSTSIPAPAADGPLPLRIRGTIVSIGPTSVSIKQADGKVVTAKVTADASYSTVEKRRFEQIKSTDFIGITSMPGPKGTPQAQEIHVLPAKGFHEGSYPWDFQRDGQKPAAASATNTTGTVTGIKDDQPSNYTMTNASVTASTGMQLKVTYQGEAVVNGKCIGRASHAKGKPCIGEALVDVPPWTPIVAVVPGKVTDAKAGLATLATGTAYPDGKLEISVFFLEKHGVKPKF
jgi:hypothetical protein